MLGFNQATRLPNHKQQSGGKIGKQIINGTEIVSVFFIAMVKNINISIQKDCINQSYDGNVSVKRR